MEQELRAGPAEWAEAQPGMGGHEPGVPAETEEQRFSSTYLRHAFKTPATFKEWGKEGEVGKRYKLSFIR